MNKLLMICFVIVLPFILTGCDDDDWGEKIEKFVDNEVHGLTIAIAQNELDVRWFDYFNGLTTKSILVVDGATRLVDTSSIASAPLNTFEEREKTLTLIDVADANNIQAAIMLRSAISELDSSKAICESANALYKVDIASIGSKMAAQIAIPQAEWYVEVNCEFGSGGDQGNGGTGDNKSKGNDGSGCWKSLVSVVTAIFGADKQKQQADKANAAIARIPSKVVSGSEVEQISQATCRKAAATPLLRDGVASARVALTRVQQNTLEISKALVNMRLSLEKQQMPLLVQMVRDKTGIERTARDIVAEYEMQRVTHIVDEQRKDLATFETRFHNAPNCSEMLASFDLFGRVLSEKRVQLEAAVNSGSLYSSSFTPLLSTVIEAEKDLFVQYEARRVQLCAIAG